MNSTRIALRGARPARAIAARGSWLLWAVLALAASACDGRGVPTALVVAAESEAALQIAEDLPSLPWFVARAESGGAPVEAGAQRVMAIAASLWEESLMTRAPAPQHELRETVYDVVVPILAGRLEHADLAAAHAALNAWLRMATSVVTEARIDVLDAALAEGRRLTDDLLGAIRSDEVDTEGALFIALQAADVLLETTPRVIALRMTAAGETRLSEYADESQRGSVRLDSLGIARAERLLRGAREAMAQRDYPLAIRRAFYARQLLDPGCVTDC